MLLENICLEEQEAWYIENIIRCKVTDGCLFYLFTLFRLFRYGNNISFSVPPFVARRRIVFFGNLRSEQCDLTRPPEKMTWRRYYWSYFNIGPIIHNWWCISFICPAMSVHRMAIKPKCLVYRAGILPNEMKAKSIFFLNAVIKLPCWNHQHAPFENPVNKENLKPELNPGSQRWQLRVSDTALNPRATSTHSCITLCVWTESQGPLSNGINNYSVILWISMSYGVHSKSCGHVRRWRCG